MCDHRTALRLRVISPVLLSQNNRQLNRPQSLSLTDFEGSRFDRWLRQGSGQHPLTGSPQHLWGFLVSATGRPGERFAACCSGALAVLSGSGQSPGAGHHYSPRHILDHQDCDFGLGAGGAGGSALVIWVIWPSRNLIRSLALARSALSWFTSSLSMARAGGSSSGMSINHLLPTMVPVITPLANLRLMVFGETPRAIAASCIESCMTQMVNHHGYAEPWLSVKPSPSLPRLSKYRSMASVDALRPGAGQLDALRPGAGQLDALRPGAGQLDALRPGVDCGQVGGAE